MKPAIAWTVSAVIFVAMFIGARVYISRELSRPLESAPVLVQPMPRVERSSTRPAIRWIEAALRGEPGAANAAHAALDRLVSEQVAGVEAAESLAPLQAALDEADQPGLAAHVMHTRAWLLQQSGAPDAALEAALEARRAASPADFDWTMPEEEPDPPEGEQPSGEDVREGEVPL